MSANAVTAHVTTELVLVWILGMMIHSDCRWFKHTQGVSVNFGEGNNSKNITIISYNRDFVKSFFFYKKKKKLTKKRHFGTKPKSNYTITQSTLLLHNHTTSIRYNNCWNWCYFGKIMTQGSVLMLLCHISPYKDLHSERTWGQDDRPGSVGLSESFWDLPLFFFFKLVSC